MFIDSTGGIVRGFDQSFSESSDRSHACMHTVFWVPAPGGGAPFVVLEQLSNDQGAALLIKSILELQRMQVKVAGRAVQPVRVNIDMGRALLVAAVESWNRVSVLEYLAFAWGELRSKGAVDWSGWTVISWCRTHMHDAIKLWNQTTLRYSIYIPFLTLELRRCGTDAKPHFLKLCTSAFYVLEASPSIAHAEGLMRFFVWMVSQNEFSLDNTDLQVPGTSACWFVL